MHKSIIVSLQNPVIVILHRVTFGAADCSAVARPKANVDQPASAELSN